MMRAIHIPQLLQAPEQTQTLLVQDYLPDLETLTPVQGEIRVSHRGNYLEVAAQAETIVTLACSRCLQQYNHRLKMNTTELIWLEDLSDHPDLDGTEREIAYEDLVETLPPQGYFHPSAWLYEQLCLALPARQLCDAKCSGILPTQANIAPKVDSRWASLEALKQNLSNN